MKKILFLFNIIFKSKKIYKNPNKCEILIYDNVHPEIFLDILNHYKIDELDIRFKSINIFVLAKSLLKNGFKNIIFNYSLEYILLTRPKLVITLTDTLINFYKFKKKTPNIIYIAVQYAYRGIKYPDLFQNIIKNKINDLECDYIFCFGKKVAEFYEQLINCNTITLGSLRNNQYINILPRKNIKKRIGFISQFRDINRYRNKKISGINRDEFYFSEKKNLPIIYKICKDKNYEFCIIGCSLLNHNDEIKFFKSLLLTDDFTYLPPKKYEDSYNNANTCDILVFIDSTLGYEMLARGKRAICIHSRPPFYNVENKFGWPSSCEKKGFFWTNENNFNEISRIFQNADECSDSIWEKSSKLVNDEIISFNNQNSILVKKIDEILKYKTNEN